MPPEEYARPVDVAEALYAKHGLNFRQDLDYHLRYGYVIALPTCFAMATIVELKGGAKAWFVKVATGNRRHLADLMPLPLPFVAFCRWKSREPERIRVYPTELLQRFARVEGLPVFATL